MKIIDIDLSEMTQGADLDDALLSAIDAPIWHGRSLDAYIDSMVYGGVNGLEPPYRVRLHGIEKTEDIVRADALLLRDAIAEARNEKYEAQGEDVEVSIEIVER